VSYAGAASAEMALRRGAPPEYKNHAGTNCSPGNPAPERNPELKRTRIGDIFKKFLVKTTFKLKINVIRNSSNFRFYST
jgi:hypothetical protein